MKADSLIIASSVTELEWFENKENLWKFCIENLWKKDIGLKLEYFKINGVNI